MSNKFRESERASHRDIWGKSAPGRGDDKCKSLELGILGELEEQQTEVRMAKAEWVRSDS